MIKPKNLLVSVVMNIKFIFRKINLFNIFNCVLMLIICFVTLYPIWFSVVLSFNEGRDIAVNGNVFWWPRVFTLENYSLVFSDSTILKAFAVSIARTLIGTTTHVFFTAMVAYACSKQELIGRKIYMAMGVITLFFSGGLIPTYMLMKNLHLIDTFWVYILPTAFSFFDVIIFMNFFQTIPASIEESARIDGAHDFLIFIKLILPLSTAVLATIAIFSGVFNWNDFFMGVIYINKKTDLLPIQTFLYKMVSATEAYDKIAKFGSAGALPKVTPQSVRVATMVVTTIPIICVYPFLQKYFTKGIMLGSVKE